MNPHGSAREALIAEALGDLAHLLERAEALQPAMLESRQALLDAHAQLAQQLATFEAQVVGFTEHAKGHTAKHIQARTDEATRQLVRLQTKAMSEAAQVLFKEEIHPTLQRLAAPMYQLLHRVEHPWEGWLTHAATVVVTSSVTCTLTLYLWVW